MTLPVLETPTYFMELPSTKERLKFRPFLVKEEKILLIAMQEEDGDVLFEAIRQIIKNCTFGQVDVDALTTYDLEYIFLQLRIKSKGGDVDLSFRCDNEVGEDGDTCGHSNSISFDLNSVKVQGDISKVKKVILDEKTQTGLIMKPPSFAVAKGMQQILMEGDVSEIYKTLPKYIDTIFQGDVVYEDFTNEELQEWVENLSDSQFQLIQKFFDSLPKLKADIEVACAKCGYKETIPLEGLQSFLE